MTQIHSVEVHQCGMLAHWNSQNHFKWKLKESSHAYLSSSCDVKMRWYESNFLSHQFLDLSGKGLSNKLTRPTGGSGGYPTSSLLTMSLCHNPIEESRTWGHNSSALPMWAGPPARTGWDCPLSPLAGGLLQTDRPSPSAGRTLLTQGSPTCPTGDLLSEPFMQIALPGQPDIAALSWGLVTR